MNRLFYNVLQVIILFCGDNLLSHVIFYIYNFLSLKNKILLFENVFVEINILLSRISYFHVSRDIKFRILINNSRIMILINKEN